MSTILVTGVAGFIASRVAQRLLGEGEAVIGVDNINDYYDKKLKHYRLNLLKQFPNFSFYRTDIEDMGQLSDIFLKHKIDSIINLAARAGVRYSIKNPHIYLTTNAHGTLNLLELMREHDIQKMVLASSSSLYAGQQMPFTEDLPVNTPISPYAVTKRRQRCLPIHTITSLDLISRSFATSPSTAQPEGLT